MKPTHTILICGSRYWTNYKEILSCIRATPPKLIIHGGACGADSLAALAARTLHIPTRVFHTEWSRFGRRAFAIRNAEMLSSGKPNAVWMFHHAIHTSRGTWDMLLRAAAANLPIYLNQGNGLQEITPEEIAGCAVVK